VGFALPKPLIRSDITVRLMPRNLADRRGRQNPAGAAHTAPAIGER